MNAEDERITKLRDFLMERLVEHNTNIFAEAHLEELIATCNTALKRSVDVDGSDTSRLNWLEAQSTHGLPWIARPSATGRGFRLHQGTEMGVGMRETAREAIDVAMMMLPNNSPR